MCLAQGPQCSEAREAQTRGLSVSSQDLYHFPGGGAKKGAVACSIHCVTGTPNLVGFCPVV